MAPSEAEDSPVAQNAENDLQPFFILHKAKPRQSERKSAGKTSRRIDLSPSLPKLLEKSKAVIAEGYIDQHYENLRMEALNCVWSNIELTIKDVLRNINVDVFNEIDCWVHELFDANCSSGMPDLTQAIRSYPIVTDVVSKQLFTGLILTRNMEYVDDLLMFVDLGLHLKSHGCHVANLSSMDFSAKNGIGGCIRSLLRQFLMVSLDAADISLLASWYGEQGNNKIPLVVIIDDMERCCGPVLSDFILMLSEWVVKIPIILIMGVATTIDALRNILSSNALQYLSPRKFILGSPAERLDAIIEAVLVKRCSGFSVGHNVATFLRNCFLRQDGTLTSLIRALKMAIVQHFSMEPLSFILKGLLKEEDNQVSWSGKLALLSEVILKQAFDLPSYRRYKVAEPNADTWALGLLEMKKLQKFLSSVVLCLFEAGKYHKITLLDLYCEALDPELYDSRASDHHSALEKYFRMPISDQGVHGQYLSLHKGGFICQAICQLRDLPASALCQLLESWEKLTEGINEIHEKVKELQSLMKFEDDKCLKQELTSTSKRQITRSNLYMEKDAKALNEKAAALLGCMVRDHMQPIECIPFHEIVCFKNVDELQLALIGNPRRRIQVDLMESHKFLKCNCCSKKGNIQLPSVHDTSIMYSLAQEHGDLINLHDWYQSFKATVLHPNIKGGKHRLKQSPSPKKRKIINEPQNISESSVQARFCRAVMELQVTGLLRMPSKRRPDYVQRVAFGL